MLDYTNYLYTPAYMRDLSFDDDEDLFVNDDGCLDESSVSSDFERPAWTTHSPDAGGSKETSGKLDYSLFPATWLKGLTEILDRSANGKYARNNWRKGILYSRCLAAAERHIQAFRLGESFASDDHQHHLLHACVELLFLYTYDSLTHVYSSFDDREDNP